MSTLPTAMIETTQRSMSFVTADLILNLVFLFAVVVLVFRAGATAFSTLSESARRRTWRLLQLVLVGMLFLAQQCMDAERDPTRMKTHATQLLLIYVLLAACLGSFFPSSMTMEEKHCYESEYYYVSHKIFLMLFRVSSGMLVLFTGALYLLTEVHSWYPTASNAEYLEFAMKYLRYASAIVLLPLSYSAVNLSGECKKEIPALTTQTSSNS